MIRPLRASAWSLALLPLAMAGVSLFSTAADGPKSRPETVQFNRDIRSILSDNCFACHGPDKNKRKADLRLDTEEGLLGRGEKKGTVVPGKPDESELWIRITSKEDTERMPPPEFAKELSEADRQVIRRWIEQGAKWEGHWAFQPITQPAPPAVDRPGFVRNEIDRFVLQTQQEHGLQPAAEADRVTLLRRLSFDLTGLPPDPEDVDAFVADQDPQAYEKVVDRLLASPEYGERMAMWWLDLVRYADSVGYHGDQPVSVSPFRDYVIRSFNENKPFDRFTLEQLAGDLLPNPTAEHKIASGYNRLGMMSAEGGVQPKEYLAKYIAERVRNVSGTWLGVTLGCCECHDHKYDPFTIRDFYSMEAFFADIKEQGLYSGSHASGIWGPQIAVPTAEEKAQLDALAGRIAALRQQLDTATPELAAAQKTWESEQAGQLAAWIDLKPESVASSGGATLTPQPDGSILASGTNPETDTYTLTIKNPPAGITAFRIDVLPHDSLPKKGPGRGGNGNFVLTEFSAALKADGASEQTIALQSASATHEQTSGGEVTPYKKWAIAAAIDGDAKGPNWGWAILDQVGRPNQAVFETVADLPAVLGAVLTLTMKHNYGGNHAIGRFRIRTTTSPRPVRAGTLPENVAKVLTIATEQRSEAQKNEIAAYYRTIAPLLAPVRQSMAEAENQRAALEKGLVTTLVTERVEPRMVRVLARGNWMDDNGEVMSPAFPGILPQAAAKEGRLTRVDLAQWLTSKDNPLTARVFVNRLWKLYFGAGLSRKVDDVGAQGDWPSHPQLLDCLAGQFVDSGWNVKHVVKQIVMSGAYRQSSQPTPQTRELDPANRWLGRQGRFRLDAEMVRDNALKISSLLVEQVGGPSVKPYQPPGYWAYLNFPIREWDNGKGSELYRRGLYTHWQRQYLHPALLAFDAPSREECTADRNRSNTPLQSLVLLNDPEYVEAARAFAEKILANGGRATQERLTWAFRRSLSRAPREKELLVLQNLLESHLAEYQQDPKSAQDLLTVGTAPVPSTMAAPELAAWTSIARVILNLHETITRN